jgi:hypothetical protein
VHWTQLIDPRPISNTQHWRRRGRHFRSAPPVITGLIAVNKNAGMPDGDRSMAPTMAKMKDEPMSICP